MTCATACSNLSHLGASLASSIRGELFRIRPVCSDFGVVRPIGHAVELFPLLELSRALEASILRYRDALPLWRASLVPGQRGKRLACGSSQIGGDELNGTGPINAREFQPQ